VRESLTGRREAQEAATVADDRSDVIVVGGGPAGSTAASFLAMKGYDVQVFERAKMPRDHVGESLLPFCYGLFEELGVLAEMEDRYVRKPGVRFLDVDDVTSTTYCFHHKIHDPSYLSFHVLRSEFDELLLLNSAAKGARVTQETKVVAVDFEDGGGVTVGVVGPDGERVDHRTRFVIDASGRDTFLANRMGTKTAHKELERTALGSHWRGANYTGGLEEGMIQIVYTGGDKLGWIWIIPLSADRLSAGVVMNTSYYLEQRRKLKAEVGDDWQLTLYRQELFASAFCQEVLADAEQFWPVIYNGDYSYFCHQKYGDNFALVGDASAFIDPIFSSGVYLGMNSAKLLADAVDVRLREGSEQGLKALDIVYDQIVGAYDLVDKLIRLFYTPEVLNFAQLGNAEGAFGYEHHQNAMSLQHFLLAGDFFEQSHRYTEFIDELRSPRRFEQYKSFVIKRPTFRADRSCEHEHEVVFGERMERWNAERAARGL
jgi:hypothetical protein